MCIDLLRMYDYMIVSQQIQDLILTSGRACVHTYIYYIIIHSAPFCHQMAEVVQEKSRGLKFAEQQLLRHGWEHGKILSCL